MARDTVAGISEVSETSAETLAQFDAIIDVRSPREFAEDHLPDAVNLPVLSNDERTLVCTTYEQVSKFKAQQEGAAFVARNIGFHLEQYFADKPKSFRFLMYCSRSGMRSRATANILSQVGWAPVLLNGGYATWRQEVVSELRVNDAPLNIILLDGQTGAAKTAILQQAARRGVQTIDLETLATHRGSVFGDFVDRKQPQQKKFESNIWDDLRDFDPQRPVLIEAESNRIGRRQMPPRIWRSMLKAPRIVVRADALMRAEYLTTSYADIIAEPSRVDAAIGRLAPYHDKSRIDEWRNQAANKDYTTLAADLMRRHYDPLYDRSRKRRADKPLAELSLTSLAMPALIAAAEKIRVTLRQLSPEACKVGV